jgi:hypothetical protein
MALNTVIWSFDATNLDTMIKVFEELFLVGFPEKLTKFTPLLTTTNR